MGNQMSGLSLKEDSDVWSISKCDCLLFIVYSVLHQGNVQTVQRNVVLDPLGIQIQVTNRKSKML